MTKRQARRLAFEYASSIGATVPKTWKENELAGIDRLEGFKKRACWN